MYCLAVIGAMAAAASCTGARKAATEPGKVAPSHASGNAEPRPFQIASANAQERALRASLAQTAVVILNSGGSLELWYPARLAFVPDGMELLPAATAMLDLVARSLREFEHSQVVVAVYTDSIGSTSYNQQQSQDRADAVVAYLETKGVARSRLEAKGVGESAPLEAPNTPEGRELNRRLQVVITPLS